MDKSRFIRALKIGGVTVFAPPALILLTVGIVEFGLCGPLVLVAGIYSLVWFSWDLAREEDLSDKHPFEEGGWQ